MEDKTFVLITIMLIPLATFILSSITLWLIHVVITLRESVHRYGWATYSTFKKEFSKIEWRYDVNFYTREIELRGDGSRINDFSYKLDLKDMIIRDPVSYFLSRMYIRWHTKKYKIHRRKAVKIKWRSYEKETFAS